MSSNEKRIQSDRLIVNGSTNSLPESSPATPAAAARPVQVGSMASVASAFEMRTNKEFSRSGTRESLDRSGTPAEPRERERAALPVCIKVESVADLGTSDEDSGTPGREQLSVSELAAVANRFDINLNSLVGTIIRANSQSAFTTGTPSDGTTPAESSPVSPQRQRAPPFSSRTHMQASDTETSPTRAMRRAVSADVLNDSPKQKLVLNVSSDLISPSVLGSNDKIRPVQPSPSRSAGFPEDPTQPLLYNSASSKQSSLAPEPLDTTVVSMDGSGATSSQPAKRAVRFAPPSELNRVTAYEVDNSIYISIEYSRPLIGWVMLFMAALFCTVEGIIGSYRNAMKVNPYVAATWVSFGQLIVAVVAGVSFFSFQTMSRRDVKFMTSRDGIILLAVTGCIHAFMSVAHQATVHMTDEWRFFALTSVHPLIITMFGKVFKNTVFLNEVGGTFVLLTGYAIAMIPSDIKADNFAFGSLLGFSQGIYTASFLFLCTKARAKVPIPIVFIVLAVTSAIVQLCICGFSFKSISFDTHDSNGVFGFAVEDRTVWLINGLCSSCGLLCYLLALRFLPPVTVSAIMVLQPLMAELIAFLVFFNPPTAVWPVGMPPTPTPAPLRPGEGLLADASSSSTIARWSWDNAAGPQKTKDIAGSHQQVYSLSFSIGATLCALATGYIVYVSSIKRAKVDMLVRSLNRRRRPKNPYTPRSAPDVAEGGKETKSVAQALAREKNAIGRQKRRQLGQRALENLGPRRSPDQSWSSSSESASRSPSLHSSPTRTRSGSAPTSPVKYGGDQQRSGASTPRSAASIQSLDAYYDEM